MNDSETYPIAQGPPLPLLLLFFLVTAPNSHTICFVLFYFFVFPQLSLCGPPRD